MGSRGAEGVKAHAPFSDLCASVTGGANCCVNQHVLKRNDHGDWETVVKCPRTEISDNECLVGHIGGA